MLLSIWKVSFFLFFLSLQHTHLHSYIYIYIYTPSMSLKVFFPHTHFSTYIISLIFFKMLSISFNSNFYDFWVKFPESWYLFIPNLARVISNFTKLLVGTFSFMKFTSIKILFIFSCLFIYINTWKKYFNSDSRIYHHFYNLIYHFLLFFWNPDFY
jgi:hypothetical protein